MMRGDILELTAKERRLVEKILANTTTIAFSHMARQRGLEQKIQAVGMVHSRFTCAVQRGNIRRAYRYFALLQDISCALETGEEDVRICLTQWLA